MEGKVLKLQGVLVLCCRFFDNLGKLNVNAIPGRYVVNIDETCCVWKGSKTKVVCARGQRMVKAQLANSKSGCTVVFSIAANGSTLRPYVILKVCHFFSIRFSPFFLVKEVMVHNTQYST